MTAPGQPRRVWIVISADESYADVTVDGDVRRITGDSPKRTRRQALEVALSLAAATGNDVVIDAADAHSSWRLMATPGGVIRELRPDPPTKRSRFPLRGAVVLGVVALAVVGLGAAIAARVPLPFSPSADPEDSDRGRVEPGVDRDVELEARGAPPGYSEDAEWRISMAGGTSPAVAPDGDTLVVVTRDEALVAHTPDGERQWSQPFVADVEDVQGPIRVVPIGGDEFISVVTSDTLWLWPLDGGDPEELALPDDVSVSFAGGSPLLTHEDEPPMIPVDGEFVELSLPEDARALASDGQLVVAAEAGEAWTLVEPGEDAEAVDAQEPGDAGDLTRVLTASADHVVVEWESEDGDDDESVIAVHDAEDGSLIGSALISDDDRGDEDRWQSAEAWGAYGPLLVDLNEGETEVQPGFHPVGAAGEDLYGELDGELTAVDADGSLSELAGDTARPWGLLGGRAVVVAERDIYVLPPE
ncbi:hypothetical protein J4H86_05270 [Spiractinospora alimapuensis]|uniref:hypothetical protein n=1 Tax=Spiractinospora alimapuensis TaxID=2820884 RepID=UPI001F36EF6D|nr:hypothetical protein [Spiractinospora alimapuensis]QVQ53194.1 hypothetical protein J4H86_05270 [Spiractinospora alimapuensis]